MKCLEFDFDLNFFLLITSFLTSSDVIQGASYIMLLKKIVKAAKQDFSG